MEYQQLVEPPFAKAWQRQKYHVDMKRLDQMSPREITNWVKKERENARELERLKADALSNIERIDLRG